MLEVVGADEKNEVFVLPPPNKFVVGALVVDPKGLGSVDGVVEDPKPPKIDGFGASVAVVELVLLPNGKGSGAAGAVVEVGAGANEDDPGVILDVPVSFAGIENGLGALDEPNALVVLLKSRKPGLGVGRLKLLVGVDDGADFKLSNPANEGGGAGIEGMLVFGVSLPLEDSSNSFWILERKVLYFSKISVISAKGSFSINFEMEAAAEIFNPRRLV